MQAFLKENTTKLAKIKMPLPIELRIPINTGRITGVKARKTQQVGGFAAALPNEDSIALTEWLNYKADRGDLTSLVATTGAQTIAGDKTFSGDITFSGEITADVDFAENLTFTETVTSPATSSTMTLVQKQIVHTVSGGATEVIPINVPDGSLIMSAELLVSEALTFTTGTAVTATWTNSTQQIGGTDALAAKNSKVGELYDANGNSAIATGTPETITLTADAGTVDDGEVVVIVRYWTISGIADVA